MVKVPLQVIVKLVAVEKVVVKYVVNILVVAFGFLVVVIVVFK